MASFKKLFNLYMTEKKLFCYNIKQYRQNSEALSYKLMVCWDKPIFCVKKKYYISYHTYGGLYFSFL
jgi:hypothetical protein